MDKSRCNRIRLFDIHRKCSECVINVSDYNDMSKLDFISIINIMFVISTDSKVSQYQIRLKDNEITCDGKINTSVFKQTENAEQLNIQYCTQILIYWIACVESYNSPVKQLMARQYVDTISRVEDIQSMRKLLLSSL